MSARAARGCRTWFDTWDGPIAWAMARSHGRRSAATSRSRYGLGHMTGTKKDGEKVDLWLRCHRRPAPHRDGAWKITHQHTSVPFHMDGSFKAAVDLKP